MRSKLASFSSISKASFLPSFEVILPSLISQPASLSRVSDRRCKSRTLPVPSVPEQLAPRVEGEALHAGRQLVRDLRFHDPAVLDRRDVVGRRPVARDILLPDVDLACLEGFELDGDVAIVLVADDVVV